MVCVYALTCDLDPSHLSVRGLCMIDNFCVYIWSFSRVGYGFVTRIQYSVMKSEK